MNGERRPDPRSTLERLRLMLQAAYLRAPAVRTVLDAAGLEPDAIHTASDLAAIPVTRKESLPDLQRATPPFGGFLWAEQGDIKHVFASPGPIYEPQFRSDLDCRGCTTAFRAAGIGPEDVVLNTWSYHLVPAGLMFDEGLCATGATVVPSGTGNTEQQARLIVDLSVSVILASTSYFVTLLDKLEELDLREAAGRLRLGYLGGEFGDWVGKRRALEKRYRVATGTLYGTGELGIVAYERPGDQDLEVHADRIVQVCDLLTGLPLPLGEIGEVVVTSLSPGWAMVRLGTGDLTHATEVDANGFAKRIAPLQGRVGLAVKVREIFVYPRSIEILVSRVPGLLSAQVRITRPGHRDEIELRLALADGTNSEDARRLVAEVFHELSRLRADRIILTSAEELAQSELKVLDERT